MKIQIDQEGNLKIERAGRMKAQLCPFASTYGLKCGDWCPHFDEPEPCEQRQGTSTLDLCHRRQLFGELEDLRVKK